jgi:hypothetical protein
MVTGITINYGQATISSVNTNGNTGTYDITFTPAHPTGSNYAVIAYCVETMDWNNIIGLSAIN